MSLPLQSLAKRVGQYASTSMPAAVRILEMFSAVISMPSSCRIRVEAYWPTLFAKLCKGKDMGAMISAVGSGGGGGGGAAPAAAAGGAAPAAGGDAPAAKAPEPEE